MLIKSALATQISGSIGGITGAHNKGGMYIRSRSIPTNPQTARQTAVRDMMSMYSQMWTQVLTQAQRDAWATFAANVPVIGPLGDTINLSGQQHYLRANVGRSAASSQLAPTTALTSINEAPTTFDLPMLLPPTIGDLETGGDLIFDDAAAWVDSPADALLVYYGRPRNPGVNYFTGPYRLAFMVQGDATTPPASPFAIPSSGDPATIWPGTATGQKVKVKFVLSVGSAANQPTGKSAPTFTDEVVP